MTEETIFQSALQRRSPAERSSYLDQACGGDTALRQRVEALLRKYGAGTATVERPAPGSSGAGALTETTAPEATRPPLPGAAGATGIDAPALDFLTPTAAPDVLGRLGHYDGLSVVGRGGMGVVLRAFDTKLHRVVALKVMAPELAAGATARQRFVREARAAAAVCHGNVVTIHAVEEDHRPPLLVMQYVEGASLQDRLEHAGPPEPREILRVGRETAAGLAAAHRRGLIHRDIKPANVLLEDGSGRVKITDFGLARAVDDASLTQSGVVAGTPMYMSPEQAEGRPLDARSNLFSLGSVLYCLCTGRPPSPAGSTMAVLRRVCEAEPSPVREVNPAIPELLAEIIGKLHAKAPAARFQSADEVAEALGQCLDRLGREEVRPAAAPAGKRRLRYAAAALAGIVLLGAGVFVLRPRGEKVRPPDDAAPSAKVETPHPPATADLLREAVLLMDFERDDFFERDGETYVRDRSGRGNDGLCENVAFTPDGKAGGGLECRGGRLRLRRSLVNYRPSFTLTAWVRVRGEGGQPSVYLLALASNLRGSAIRLGYDAGGALFTGSFNVNFPPDFWYPYKGPTNPLFARGEWFFLALTLRGGAANAGDMRLTVDDRSYSYPSQMPDNGDPFQEGLYEFLGNEMHGVLDEVAVFPRALSDAEVQAVRRAGLRGEPLSAARITTPTPPPLPPAFLRSALLLMDFEKESFYERDGKTWVRDHSGHGHDGVCDGVAFTPEGLAGGGLACAGGLLRLNGSFINRLPEYTLTAWVRMEDERGDLASIYARAMKNRKNANYALWVVGGNLGVHAFNLEARPDPWFSSTTNQPEIPRGRWTFVAAVLRNGGAGKGDLRLLVNSRAYDRKSQTVNGPPGGFFDALGVGFKAVLDEVTLFPRALSEVEVAEIRRQGLDGRPLGRLGPPGR